MTTAIEDLPVGTVIHYSDDRKTIACRQARGKKGKRYFADDIEDVTCGACKRTQVYRAAFAAAATVAALVEEVYTDSDPVVPRQRALAPDGMPFPDDTEEAIGWMVDVLQVDGSRRVGMVRDASYLKLKVHYPGECSRSCCLDEVLPREVEFLKMAPCEKCDSGLPFVLCICDDPVSYDASEDKPAPKAEPKSEPKQDEKPKALAQPGRSMN